MHFGINWQNTKYMHSSHPFKSSNQFAPSHRSYGKEQHWNSKS